MRKLASIKKIVELCPMEGYDNIELARIDGWNVIVKKGEFNKENSCVFFEIDSFLPDIDVYAFLGKPIKYLGKSGHRIKTKKLKQYISQGLALPLGHFTETVLPNRVDCDVTEVLGILKYDKETVESTQSGSLVTGSAEGKFPSFIPKTDQTRIQSLPAFFTQHATTLFEETLKLDGSSCTMYKINQEATGLLASIKRLFGFNTTTTHFGVCSRNLEIKRPVVSGKKSDFWTAAVKYHIEEFLPEGYAIQGELIAPNIQSNWEKVSEVEYYIFDVYDIKNGKHLLPRERRQFVETVLPFAKHIPVMDEATVILALTQEEILARVNRPSMNPKTISEGSVYKAVDNPTVSFKCISNAYLLKEK